MYRAYISFIKDHPRTLAIAAVLLIAAGFAFGLYIPTNRDTRLPPAPFRYVVQNDSEYTLLAAIGDLEFYYREDRDIFLVQDKRNGYSWKTGLDVPFNTDIDRAVAAAQTDEAKIAAALPKEDRLNSTYIGFANSLFTVEMYDDAFNTQLISSAAQRGSSSRLAALEPNHYRLDAEFPDMDLSVKVHVYLSAAGLNYRILDEEITGTGAEKMASIIITPFLGASGGVQQFYDPELKRYEQKEPKAVIPGYVFVPDGSGALIRFRDNTVSLQKYVGTVYGINPAETMYYYNNDAYSVAKKEPLMPVFGISHGNSQAAFAAWAEDGAEHLEIHVSPEENMTWYTFAYPRFVYNRQIHQVYNRKGEGYYRLYPERLHFNASMNYHFLAGDSEEVETDTNAASSRPAGADLPADYVGMALAYREYLIANGTLIDHRIRQDNSIPIRIDFVMSDIKKSIIGNSNVVTTTANDAGVILRDLLDAGVKNINSGLLGFQNGGIMAGKPWTLNFSRTIGSKGDFQNLFRSMAENGIDVSFSQNYSLINKLQMMLPRNQAYHINHWGVRAYISQETFVPVNEVSYARPAKSAEWLAEQTGKAQKLGVSSATITGIPGLLISHYGDNGTNAEETVQLYQDTLEKMDILINAETPNSYLWKYVDRFLKAPVLNTQYILETDTVPFLQILLNGTMELYAPYSNFSFYTQEDILRMIDYNVYPSFVITSEPAHLLSNTNSLTYYSTEYGLYRDIIRSVYDQVSRSLAPVKGTNWINRQVLADGVIMNSYENGARILINYSGDDVPYQNVTIPALTARVFRDGEL
jgi:hypothetical protein